MTARARTRAAAPAGCVRSPTGAAGGVAHNGSMAPRARRLSSAVVALAVALLVAGCGGEGDDRNEAQPSTSQASTTSTTSVEDALAEWLDGWRPSWEQVSDSTAIVQSYSGAMTDPADVQVLVDVSDAIVLGLEDAGPPPAAYEDDAADLANEAQRMADGFRIGQGCAPVPSSISAFTDCLNGQTEGVLALQAFNETLLQLVDDAGIPGPS